jgi:hypothetical protein
MIRTAQSASAFRHPRRRASRYRRKARPNGLSISIPFRRNADGCNGRQHNENAQNGKRGHDYALKRASTAPE